MPAISVVIPFYNRARYIAAAVDSVLAQTLPPAEVILVDDASSPAHARALDALADRARVLRLPRNQGVAAARNAGLRAARGELVAFLDSDDLWEPDKLAVQAGYLAEHPECAGVHGAVRAFYADGREVISPPLPPHLSLAEALYHNVIRVQTLLCRREALLGIGGFDPALRTCEDDDLGIRLAAAGLRIDYLPAPLTRLRREGHDHLFGSWRRIVLWKTRVAFKHRRLLESELGPGATRRRIARALRLAGSQRGRVVGRVLSGVGRVLGGAEGTDAG